MKYFIFTILFLVSNYVHAAELRFESDATFVTPEVDSSFNVVLYLLPKDERINALEGTIVVSGGAARIEEVSIADSIMSAWVKTPSRDDLSFSAIIAGGFDGVRTPYDSGIKPGKVLTIKLKAIAPGKVDIEMSSPRILLADGLGSNVAILGLLPIEIEVIETQEREPFGFENGIIILLALVLFLCLSKRYISPS